MLRVELAHRLGAFSLDAGFASGPGLTALFGRSGSGKTTVVNMIAGLLRPERGHVMIDDIVLLDTARGVFVPKHRRRIGYVFQDARLFPHLTVRHNLLFGRWFTPPGERSGKLDDVVELLGIGHLLARRPGALSGGERQRVAIGRALLANPRLLLMDEPLAALDVQRKDEILPYIERLRDETRVPIVYVSHSIPEVTRLATTMVLMSEGCVDAVGSVGEIMSRLDLYPKTGRFEAGAVIEMRVIGHDARFALTRLEGAVGAMTVPRLDLPHGAAVRLRIRARDVIIATTRPSGISALNVLAGRVAELGPEGGPVRDLSLDVGGERLLARVTQRSIVQLGLAPGRQVYAVIKTVAIDRAVPSATPVHGGDEMELLDG